jgi:hypothetical protein
MCTASAAMNRKRRKMMKGNQRFKVTKSKRIPIMLSTHEAKNDETVIGVLLAAPSCHAEALCAGGSLGGGG